MRKRAWTVSALPRRDGWYLGWCSVLTLIGILMAPLARALRPLPPETGPITTFVVGVLPNFGAGLALPFFLFVSLQQLSLARAPRPLFRAFGHAAAVTFFFLLAWEGLQQLVWGYRFDVYDVLATDFGVLAAVAGHRGISGRQVGTDTGAPERKRG